MAVLKSVADDLKDDANMEKPPSFEGRFLTIMLVPASNSNGQEQKQEAVSSAEA